jgi:conjugal transfer pilus assembly protein TraD
MEHNAFEVSNRPNFELMQFIAWLLSGGTTMVLSSYLGIDTMGALVLASPAFAMMFYRGIPAHKKIEEKKSMTGGELEFITTKELQQKVKDNPDKLWFGSGFNWTGEQTQRMMDIYRSVPERTLPPAATKDGYHWLHGLGEKKDVYIDIGTFDSHTLLVGTTGSGKTRAADILIAQLIARNEVVIILDPKGDKDMSKNAKKTCTELGQPERFAYFNPAFAEKSVRIDPLKNWANVTEIPSRIQQVISNGGDQSDPFVSFFWSVLNDIAQCMVYVGERPTLYLLYYYASSPSAVSNLVEMAVKKHLKECGISSDPSDNKQLQQSIQKQNKDIARGLGVYYFEQVREQYPNTQIDGVWGFFNRNADHYQKMTSGVMPTMTKLTSGPLKDLLSPEPLLEDTRSILDMSKVVSNNMVLYVGLNSLADAAIGSAVGSILLADMASFAGRVYNYEEEENMRRINIFVDEAAEVVNGSLIQILNKARGAKFRVFMATQAFADFQAKLNSDPMARQVLGNLNNMIFLRVVEDTTQKYLESKMKKTYVKTLDTKHGSTINSDVITATRGAYGESVKSEEMPYIPGWMMGNIPDLNFFIQAKGGTMYKCKTPIIK